LKKWEVLISNSGHNQILSLLQVDPKNGISTEDINSRILAFGSNKKAAKKLKSALTLFIEACDDFTLKILIVAAIISISKIINMEVVAMITEVDHRETAWIEGFAILVAVFISSFITTLNNYQK
jgi:magnesium-transporting ATPase (P-type)